MKCFRIAAEESPTEGYRELRRHVLIGTPATLATCLMSPNRLLAAVDESAPRPQIDQFILDTNDRASQLKADASKLGQDAYVNYLVESVSTIDQVSRDGMSSSSWKNLEPGVFLGTSGRNAAFFVVHWELEPGALLPPHCHPKTSVCTLGLEGSATLRHFEADLGAPSYRDDRETEFLIRETQRLELTAGSLSSLTEYRDNIHLFVAGSKGARGIDVTTDYGGDGSFSFLEFNHDQPINAADGSYLARWIGTSLA